MQGLLGMGGMGRGHELLTCWDPLAVGLEEGVAAESCTWAPCWEGSFVFCRGWLRGAEGTLPMSEWQ